MFKGTVKEKWADLKKSSRFTGLVAALLGAIKLQNDLGKPRVEALHVPDVLKLVVSGMFLGFGFWPDGQAEFPQLPEGPKQAATERVGCGRGSVITFRPIVSSEYRRSRFDHPARTAFTVS